MKILVAVKSCERDRLRGANQAIRETWGRELPATFFRGLGAKYFPEGDEIELPCPDDYISLPEKTRFILDWSLRYGYNFTFLCDTDTFVIPERLLATGFQKYDVTGHIGGNTENGRYFPWPSGGAGYWLSRKAAQIVLDTPNNDWAEDRMVGQILGPYIQAGELKSFDHRGYGTDEKLPTEITTHFCARGMHREYEPRWMFEMYRKSRVTA